MTKKPFLIGIGGGTGSGKSTLVEALISSFSPDRIMVISQDHYYKDLSHLPQSDRKQNNFDHPDALDTQLLFEHIRSLSAGKMIERPTYDFTSHTRTPSTVSLNPTEIILFDGIFSLYYKDILDLLHFKIYVSVDDDIRFIRRLKRDQELRGRDVESIISQYLSSVRPMHFKYVKPSKHNADIIIPFSQRDPGGIEAVKSLIKQKLEQAGIFRK